MSSDEARGRGEDGTQNLTSLISESSCPVLNLTYPSAGAGASMMRSMEGE